MNIQHGDINAADSGYAKVIHVLSTAGFQFQPSGGAGDYRLNPTLIMEDNSSLNLFSGNGGSGSGTVLLKPVTLNGLVHLQIGNSPVIFSNVISGPGGFYWDKLRQHGDLHRDEYLFGRDRPALGTNPGIGWQRFDLKQHKHHAHRCNRGCESTLRPDFDPGLRADLAGQRHDHRRLDGGRRRDRVAGRCRCDRNPYRIQRGCLVRNDLDGIEQDGGNKDQIISSGNINYGGTLSVANLAGTLAAGDSFKLFSGAAYIGAFTATNPTTPGAGLIWDTSSLNSNGILKIAAGAVSPTISGITVSGGNIVITGMNNTGSGGTYHVLSSTNLAAPLTN